MNVYEALRITDELILTKTGTHLTNLQQAIVLGCWEGKPYDRIADEKLYNPTYVKSVGAMLWKQLSSELGEKVAKTNLRTVLERRSRLQSIPLSQVKVEHDEAMVISAQDWGEAPDVPVFYGRTEELATLHKWIVKERCRLVAILGMGGIGKTALSVKLAKQIDNEFEYVIWRSLHYAPPVTELLVDLIKFISNQPKTHLPEDATNLISLLIEYLRSHRCLLVLDDTEFILQPRNLYGQYCDGYEGYGELIRQVGEVFHQSCLVLISRERPRDIVLQEGSPRPVRSLKLNGLTVDAASEILTEESLSDKDEWSKLIQQYESNPLALKLVAKTIQSLFNGSVYDFIHLEKMPIIDAFKELLAQQFDRLSTLEKKIMFCIATHHHPISIKELEDVMQSKINTLDIIQPLASLVLRSLVERITNSSELLFTIQPVVKKYVLIEYIKFFNTTDDLDT